MAKVEASVPQERATLLLVDDEPAVLKVTQRLLERRGYQVVACNSAEEALTWLGREVFDVVLSDVQMPGIGGLGLLRAVHEQDAELPVILVTGNPSEEAELVAKELRAFQYLTKPVAYEQLDEVVAEATNFFAPQLAPPARRAHALVDRWPRPVAARPPGLVFEAAR